MADTAKGGRLRTIRSSEELSALLTSTPRVLVNCHAPWAAPCQQTNLIIATLNAHPATPHDTPVTYVNLEPEAVPKVLKRYRISTVPTFLLFSTTRLVRRIEGADAAALTNSAKWLGASADDVLLKAACEVGVAGDVVLVMKGDADAPKCGFCKEAVAILRNGGVVFDVVDIMTDVGLREMMKRVYEWSSFPMLFARGRLVGGLDRLREVADAGRLVEELSGGGIGKVVKKQGTEERLRGLVTMEEVVVFMKGSPEEPRCGFSRRIVDVLRGQGIQFGHFDILGDNDVRQGMKKFSDWPTFPQVYAKGKFVGGLDVVKELVEAGELKAEMGIE